MVPAYSGFVLQREQLESRVTSPIPRDRSVLGKLAVCVSSRYCHGQM